MSIRRRRPRRSRDLSMPITAVIDISTGHQTGSRSDFEMHGKDGARQAETVVTHHRRRFANHGHAILPFYHAGKVRGRIFAVWTTRLRIGSFDLRLSVSRETSLRWELIWTLTTSPIAELASSVG